MFVHFPKKLGVISLLSEISCVDPNSRAEQAWSHSVINLRSAHLHVMFLGYQKFCIAVIRTIGWAISSFISRRSQNICKDLLELLGSCSNILRVQLSSIIREQFSGERCIGWCQCRAWCKWPWMLWVGTWQEVRTGKELECRSQVWAGAGFWAWAPMANYVAAENSWMLNQENMHIVTCTRTFLRSLFWMLYF